MCKSGEAGGEHLDGAEQPQGLLVLFPFLRRQQPAEKAFWR
jgi:hypothetical protein